MSQPTLTEHIMSAEVISCTESDHLAHAHALVDGKVQGILTSADFVKLSVTLLAGM